MTESLKQKLDRLNFPEATKECTDYYAIWRFFNSEGDIYIDYYIQAKEEYHNETFYFMTSISEYEDQNINVRKLRSDSDFLAVKQFLEFLRK